MGNLIDDDDSSKPLQRHPLVDVTEGCKVIAQHSQDQRVEEILWQTGYGECVRFLAY